MSIISNFNWNNNPNPDFAWIKSDDTRYRFIRIELINSVFPSLNRDDSNLLLDSVVKIINLIHLKFNFGRNSGKSDNLLWNQLIQNRLLDLRAILNLVLPFITDNENDDNKHRLKRLRDLYLEKNDKGQFIYTNSQYNRCVILPKDNNNDIVLNRPFLKEYFLENLELLMMSIDTISNKLYVNWVDVLPVKMNNFKTMTLYTDTLSKIEKKDNPVTLINYYIDPYPGLSYADIYNVMSNHLYHEIKNIKWLIYDIVIDNKPITYINYLERVFNLAPLWDGKLWSQLTDSESIIFINRWRDFIYSRDTTNNIILHHFFYFFTKYHKASSILIRQGKLLPFLNPEDEEREENVKINAERIRHAKMGLTNVPIDEIYSFLYDQISSFSKTWFYYFIKVRKETYLSTTNDIYITPKNVYNYCKSFTHITMDGRFTELPKHWYSLKTEFIDSILARLLDFDEYNDWTRINWFNINNYIRRTYPNIAEANLPETNYSIHLEIRKNLVDIVFESLIFHGILSDFIPNSSISNNTYIESKINSSDENLIIKEKQKQIKKEYFTGSDRTNYSDYAYYFLTGQTYGKLTNYFDLLSSKQGWMFTYAMNWVSQFNFFHKYLNTRVMYITGSTGVGKSTQVPKLLLYAQKMLDYNSKGKIACTQPRINPTESNTNTISTEMGVPIRTYSKTYGKNIPTSNYYIQFKHSRTTHAANTDYFLRMETDGLLFNEIKNYPFLTSVVADNSAIYSNDGPVEWAKTYRSDNIYDIIIVDEAHEHNANMDMILTLVRDSVYVNNSIKLVIISATMEDDEPIYRRYYRTINDNRAYPLSAFIEKNVFDRANVDRRIHISPPGRTTRFKITDHYLSEKESAEITEKNFVDAGIEKTVKIINTTSGGNLLLFMSGQADIVKSMTEINSKTPANVIAFGYYRELGEAIEKFVQNIETELSNYTRYKEDINLDERDVTRRVPKGTYKRAVIIATNVAEASITIHNLKFVIDTGYAKVNVYDPLENIRKLITMPISQSSSQQRRGRVGRTSSGDFYALYSKEKVANNKTSYKIADSDVTDLLVNLLKSNPKDIFIVNSNNDINNINKFRIINNETSNLMYYLLLNPHPYTEIILRQYMYIPRINDINQYYTYFGKTTMINYTPEHIIESFDTYILSNDDDYHDIQFMSRSYTGYDDFILQDAYLRFYLIHPDENIIRRDPFTGKMKNIKYSSAVNDSYYYYLLRMNNIYVDDVRSIDFDKIQNILLPKYQLAIDNAKLQSLAVSIPNYRYDTRIHYTDIDPDLNFAVDAFFDVSCDIANDRIIDNQITIRSQLSTNLSDVSSIFSIDVLKTHNNILWYSFSLPYELDSDVLALLLMIDVCPDVSQWINPTKNRFDVEKFLNMHINNKGDIYFLWTIWQEIKKILSFEDLLKYTQINTKIYTDYLFFKEKYLRKDKIPYSEFQILDSMYKSGKMNTQDEFYYYISSRTNEFDDFFKNKKLDKIKALASNHHFSREKIMDFLVRYFNGLYIINQKKWLNEYDVQHHLRDPLEERFSLQWVEKTLILPGISRNPHAVISPWDRILETYIRAFSPNLMRYNGLYYLRVSEGVRMDPSYWSRKITLEKTFLSNKSEYMIYHTTETTSTSISPCYITPVKLEWVLRLNPIYYWYFFYDKSNILHRLMPYPSVIESLEIMNSYRSLFNIDFLIFYLDRMNDPVTMDILKNLI